MSNFEEAPSVRGNRTSRLTPDAVRRTTFERTTLGRRGYVEADVERFLVRVADEIAWASAEKAELRAEIDRLRNYFREQSIDPQGLGPAAEPSVQAVNALSMAQQAADQHIAQAEDYARQLVGDARLQYEAILNDAHDQAQAAAEAAAAASTEASRMANGDPAGSIEHSQLEAKVAYLRTFADVTQIQMRSILAALSAELDRLTEFGARGVAPPPSAPASPGGGPVPRPSIFAETDVEPAPAQSVAPVAAAPFVADVREPAQAPPHPVRPS
jgi:DivIVA domain-containing protein